MPILSAYKAYTRPWGRPAGGQPSLEYTARRRQRMREMGLMEPEGPPTPMERMSVQQARDTQAERVAEIQAGKAEEREAGEQMQARSDTEAAWRERYPGMSDEQIRAQAAGGKAPPPPKEEVAARETAPAKRAALAKTGTARQERIQGLLQDLQSVGQPFEVKARARAELRSLGEDVPEHLEAGYLEPPEPSWEPTTRGEQLEFAGEMAGRKRRTLGEEQFLIGERGFQARETARERAALEPPMLPTKKGAEKFIKDFVARTGALPKWMARDDVEYFVNLSEEEFAEDAAGMSETHRRRLEQARAFASMKKD